MGMYAGNNVFSPKDEVQQFNQSLTLGWTVLDFLELYGALHNRASAISEDVMGNSVEQTLDILGDFSVGGKLYFRPTPILRLGGGLQFNAVNAMGTANTNLGAYGIGFHSALGIDLTGLEDPVPFIARFNVGYYFDNTSALSTQIESDKYNALLDPRPKQDENRHLLTRFERFGLGINRVDLFNLGVGLESPLELTTDTYLHPIVEWNLGIPVNRQGYDCPVFVNVAQRGTVNSPDDDCAKHVGFSSYPQKLTLGARFAPPVYGLSAMAAVDIGLTGTSKFVRDLAPTPKYRVLVAIAYGYDAEPPPPPVEVPVPVEVQVKPIEGRINGTVVEQGTGTAIAGAQVEFVGQKLSSISTSELGAFTSYALEPGEYTLSITHPAYEPTQCLTAIAPEGGDVALSCEMAKAPAATGSLHALVRDPYGNTISGAVLKLSGASETTLTSDAQGVATSESLPPGEYRIFIEATDHLARIAHINVAEHEDTQTELTLAKRPVKSSVLQRGDRLLVPTLRFVNDTTELQDGGDLVLSELADLLLRDDSIRRIRIQAPGSGAVSLTRGLLLKQRLVDAGVEDARIEALGGPGRQVMISVVERASF